MLDNVIKMNENKIAQKAERSENLSTISDVLSLRRKELKITQKELSEKTNISMVSLAKYEKGERLPSYENLNRLAKVLELDYDEVCDILTNQKRNRKERAYGNE